MQDTGDSLKPTHPIHLLKTHSQGHLKPWLKPLLVALAIPGLAACQAAQAQPMQECDRYYENKQYVKAFACYKPLAEQGNAAAQYNLGYMYDNGHGVPRDDGQAISWYKKAADQGYVGAQARLGQAAQAQPMQECDQYHKNDQYAKAFACYKPLAEQGNAEAQHNLGWMYEHGHGVPQDYQQALSWYRKAAEHGNAPAQNYLGYIYDNGQGVPQDYSQAVSWYRKAAEQGLDEARRNLAALERPQHTAQHQLPSVPSKPSPQACLNVMNHFKNYIPPSGDPIYQTSDSLYGPECMKIFKNLAENGDVEAEYFFMQRAHSIAGYDEAMYWAKRLADQGDPLIQGYLAKYYFGFPSPWLGIGKKDCHKALYWAEKAIDKELEKGDGLMVLTNIYSWGCDDIKPDPDALRDLMYQH
jgi:hypothetical protein